IPEFQARVRTALRMRLLQEELRQTNERLARLALTDELTGLCNRRGFDVALQDELWRAQRFGHSLSVLMFDLDRFKNINDQWGHPQGDVVLQAFGQVLLESSRHVDKVGRYGGEEFAVVLPATAAAGAVSYADKVRAATEALAIPCTLCASGSTGAGNTGPLRITVSGGAAVALALPRSGGEVDALDMAKLANRLLHEADSCLYQAKDAGRNRVVVKTVHNLST
ncbi:MAG TPA: GGDEF domain-containing protein, partial [Abditibacteriaceae bacterium]|nr:GGDEF domain-containing protein [Abditibacteriaceae bacterium]